MAVLSIVTGTDNKILRTKSSPVKKIDKKIKKLIADLIETMSGADGLGIAAPQVGVNVRIFIARLNYNTPNETMTPMINPEFLKMSDETGVYEEGCLSVPGRFGMVRRHTAVTIRFMDKRGKIQTLNLDGLNARITQHETDHINGILFVDKMEREVTPEEAENVHAS